MVLMLLLVFLLLSVGAVALFRWLPPPASSLMVQQYWQQWWQGDTGVIAYHWVPLERIAPQMALAVVAAEDQKFPRHWGFDLDSIRQALVERIAGGPLRGASTISQQVAKNLYLWPGRSLLRKGLEAWFTLLIEGLWTKERILEVYLNIVELDRHVFGVEAASRQFFSKPASQLDRREAALLAAVLPNPILYRVEAPSQRVLRRQGWILKQMANLGPDYLDNLAME